MTHLRTRWIATLAVAVAMAAVAPLSAGPGPEHARLTAMCGTWDEGTLNGAPFTTLSWTGYNTATHLYEATRMSSTNTIRIAETGSYDDKAKQFELKADYPLGADTWRQRTVITPASADAMTVASYLSFGAVPEWKGVEIKYTRKSK